MFKNNHKRNKLIRLSVQLFFLLLILLISLNHQMLEKGALPFLPFLSSASLHSICPFGGVVSIYSLITAGSFVQKIHEASFVILAIVVFLSVLFGPVFCGWICPLGTVQELFSKIGKKIFKKRHNNFIPYRYDKYLRFLRYFLLAWVVFMTAYTAKLSFTNIDPYHALFNLWSSELAIGGLIVLFITLASSLFIERPWCKYACPFGALLGLTNFIRVFKIRRNADTCISCTSCNLVCPMNIEIASKAAVKNHQCITCMLCTSEVSCPVNDTLLLNSRGGTFRGVKSSFLAIFMIFVLFVGIYSSDLLGIWKTENSKIVGTRNNGSTDGSVGEKIPDDIKGSFSFLDISNNFDIPVGVLQQAFDIHNVSNIEEFECKDLKEYYGDALSNEIGTGSVRMFVALYCDIEYTVLEETYLPETAVNILKEKATLTESQINYIDLHIVKIPN